MPLRYEIPPYLQKIASAAKTNLQNKPECTEGDFVATFSSTLQEVQDALQRAGIDDPEGWKAATILRIQDETLHLLYEIHREPSAPRESERKTADHVVQSQPRAEENSPAKSDWEIFRGIQGVLVDALGVDPDEVTPHASLTADLGAESIDFLDIVYRLEKKFNMKIPRGELFPEDILVDSEYVLDEGFVTSEGIEKLRERTPFLNLDDFSRAPYIDNFAKLLTVQALINYVKGKMQ